MQNDALSKIIAHLIKLKNWRGVILWYSLRIRWSIKIAPKKIIAEHGKYNLSSN